MKLECESNWTLSKNENPISLYYYGANSWEKLKNPIVLIGGVHGDEPEGVFLAEKCLEWLQNYDNNNLKNFILITCINPDGYSKNSRTNANGVDLNRNFSSSNWSPEYEKDRYYPGPNPGSEIEIKALTSLISKTSPSLIIHFHSWKPCIVCTGEKGLWAAELLSKSSGFEVIDNIGYDTPGSLSSFGRDNGIPIICVEDEEHRSDSIPWPRFGEAIKNILIDKSL